MDEKVLKTHLPKNQNLHSKVISLPIKISNIKKRKKKNHDRDLISKPVINKNKVTKINKKTRESPWVRKKFFFLKKNVIKNRVLDLLGEELKIKNATYRTQK